MYRLYKITDILLFILKEAVKNLVSMDFRLS